MSNTRTIELTLEQIAFICQALGIAETKFTGIHKEIMETTVNVRKGVSTNEQSNRAKYYHDMACTFADIVIGLDKGEFDV